MNHQPVSEILLAGLIVNSASQDAILGDLHEEWVERTTRDGSTAAQLWYWGQALRTIPHLLWAWGKEATWPELGRIVGVAIVAAFGVWGTFILPRAMMAFTVVPLNRALLWLFSLAIIAVAGMIAGAGVASLTRKAPMLAVLTAGTLLLALAFLHALTTRDIPDWPSVYTPLELTTQAILSFTAMAAGGTRAVQRQAGALRQ